MYARPSKQQRRSTSEDRLTASDIHSATSSEVTLGDSRGGFLSGVQVYVGPRIHNRARRLGIWEKQLTRNGAVIQTEPHRDVTHFIVESGSADAVELPAALRRAHVVTPDWLVVSLERGARQAEEQYPVQQDAEVPAGSSNEHREGQFWDEVEHKWRPFPPHGRWLGHWRHEFESADQLELMMHATYSNDRCREIGNEALMKVLAEMLKYENALDVDHSEEDRDAINFRTLKYARVAAAVQACSYKIDASIMPEHLPYAGAASVKNIRNILASGTCSQLEQMRNDQQVTDSAGKLRPGTEGARTRAMFKKLPGVGNRMALHWWQAGLRTFEDVEEAAQPEGFWQGHRNNSTISAEAYFSLQHRQELLEDLPAAEVEEMRAAVSDALQAAAGPGWRLINVGGGARAIRSHDCDFIVTHDSNRPAEGVVKDVVAELLRQGRLWPGRPSGTAMLRVQAGRMPGHVERIKQNVLDKGPKKFSNLAADRFDHHFGMFKTKEGKARRLDLIFVPPEELGFGTLGWIGGKQFLRFMRAYADSETSMHLNSHRLLAKQGGRVWVVPEEGPPLNKAGRPEWPPGWHKDRPVSHERDVFELLRIPYHPPHERNCP